MATKFVASLYQFGYWAYLGGSLVANALYVTRDIVPVHPVIGYPIIAVFAIAAGVYGSRKEYRRITLDENNLRQQRQIERDHKETTDTFNTSVKNLVNQHQRGLTQDQCRQFLLDNPNEFQRLLLDAQVIQVLTPHFEIIHRRRFVERDSPVEKEKSQARSPGARTSDDSPSSPGSGGYGPLGSGMRHSDEPHSSREFKESPSVHFQPTALDAIPVQTLPPASALVYNRSQPQPHQYSHISDRPNSFPQAVPPAPGLQFPAIARRAPSFNQGSTYVPRFAAAQEGMEHASPQTFIRNIMDQPSPAEIRRERSLMHPLPTYTEAPRYGAQEISRHSIYEVELSVAGTEAKMQGEYSQQRIPSPDDRVLPQPGIFHHRSESAHYNRPGIFAAPRSASNIHGEGHMTRSLSFTRGSSQAE